jgi:predicted PurR-regulated permease PerM
MVDLASAPPPSAVRPPWRIAILVGIAICVVVVLRNVFVSAHQVLGWAVAAAVTAALLDPVVRLLDRSMPRAVAILVTFLLVVALAVGLTSLYTSSVLDEVDRLQEQGPEVAERIEQRDDRIGELARDIGLADQISELTDRLDARVGSGGDAVRSAALSAPAYFVAMILTIFFLLYGPRMVDGGVAQLPAHRRDLVARALPEASRRAQLYIWASIGQAAVVGVTIGLVGTVVGIPAVGLIALFGALAALVPFVGIAVGWLPVLLLGLGTAAGQEVLLVAALAVAMQVVEAVWVRRWVDRRSLHVGPAIPVVVAILGFAVYGLGGALYGCALAVFGLALADQLSPGEPLPTPVQDGRWDDDGRPEDGRPDRDRDVGDGR